VCEILGREPTDTELAMFSVEWSEHCGYGRSKQWLKLLPRNVGKYRAASGGDAGGIEVKKGLWVLFKMESHNHPSQIEPKSGAATGIGGIVRDILAMGARPIALVDTLRFAELSDPKARYIFTGVVDGIQWYGNCLAPDEYVVVRNSGHVRSIPIGDYCEQVIKEFKKSHSTESIEILSFELDTQQPYWAKVKKIFKRSTSHLLEISTAMGRRLKVTPDHLFLVWNKGTWLIKQANQLKLGDYLPLLLELPNEPSPTQSLDLIELLGSQRHDIWVKTYIQPERRQEARQILRQLVPSASKRHLYLKRGHFPLSVYLKLEHQLGLDRKDARLFLRSGKTNFVPAIITINEDFARLIGYYLAEGCLSTHGTTYKILWTFNRKEHQYLHDLCNILNKLQVRFRKWHQDSETFISVSSWFLGFLFKEVLKVGDKSHNKAIPDLLMMHNRALRENLLIGLLRGDGSVVLNKRPGSPVKVSYATASRQLFEQVVLLLHGLGIVPKTYSKGAGETTIQGRHHYTRPVYFVEIHNYHAIQQITNWFSEAINRKIRKALIGYTNVGQSHPRYKKQGSFAIVKVTDIKPINAEGITVYDFEVEGTHLFVTSGGIITHNCIGIPTVAGEVGFNDCYRTNCLVGVMCIGVAQENDLMTSAAKGAGNAVVYVGNATGRDGIGGCSILASKEMREELEMRPTVQLGDPFAEKCLIEACLEAYKTGAVVAVKDMGAAGLTCTTVEMAAAGDVGMVVDISLVPKREPDMEPWEVMMSESQERMLLIVEKGREEEIKGIFDKWGLHCVVIGRITNDAFVRIYDGKELVAEIPAKAIAEAPIKNLPAQKPEYIERVRHFDFSQLPEPDDYTDALLHLLSSPNIASKAWVYEQYDHMVQVNTVVLPGAADAAVLRLKDWDEKLGIAVTADCNSLYCYLDPYRGAQLAVAEAARNLSCVGAEPAGVTDCLCFGNPDKPDRYWQFVESVKGIADACRELGIPVVSGNVSFYNESEISVIYPSPLIGMVGVLEDVNRHATMAFKDEGDVIVLLGICRNELGGSEYVRFRFGLEVGEPPKLDWRLEKAVQAVCREGIRLGLIKSAHDCSEGGLAVCLAECCIAGEIGAIINLPLNALETELKGQFSTLLFGESASQIVVTVAPSELENLKAIAKEHSCPVFVIGKVGGSKLSLAFAGKELINEEVSNLRAVWSSALTQQLNL
ncbi:MAG: phosphoribosylformylglycinamidine synthase subunit PurL, partial [Armatimonadota bacterium]|nr:phosphoribosylformylglycinamidine synthase subunit PurL [Armatimonadota bacterium]